MAKVISRTWRSGPRKVKKTSWGYSLQVPCQPCPHRGRKKDIAHPDGTRQVRVFDARWLERKDAENALAARLLGVKGQDTEAPTGITLGEMVQKWLDQRRTSDRNKSVKDDEERSRPVVAFFGGETPLAAITTKRIAEYRTARLNTTSRRKRKLSATTINRECQVLRGALNLAHEWQEIDKLPSFKRMMAKERARRRYLSEEEITRLLAACAVSRRRDLLSIVTVALHTGLRKSELFGLRWEHIDMSRGVITVHWSTTKASRTREAEVNRDVYKTLAPLWSDAGGLEAIGPVWRGRDGEPLKSKSIDAAYGVALKRAKITDPEVNFHTLRHTFGSWFVSRGGDIFKCSKLMGHSSVRVTEQHYAELAPNALRGATSILEGLGTSSVSTQSAQSLNGVVHSAS